jgi:DNA processing protein
MDHGLSDDARAIVLLCSSAAASRGEEARPFGPRTWAKVAARLVDAGASPASLLGLDAAAVNSLPGVGEAEAVRMIRLLARSGQLAFELDRLDARGIGVLTLADDAYPARFRERLGPDAPPVLFVAGDPSILDTGGVAIVGSRDVDAASAAFAEAVATAAAREGATVVSGGARGVDQLAMRAAFDAGGRVAGLLPEGIERRVREPSTRAAVVDGLVALASPYHPGAGFTAGAAMARNKLIYALSDAAVIAASAVGTGGTWAGAVEALDARWVPVFVRVGEDVPEGNRQLLDRGALPLPSDPLPSPLLPALAGPAQRANSAHSERSAAEALAPYEQQELRLL